jgi:hypothetical protein
MDFFGTQGKIKQHLRLAITLNKTIMKNIQNNQRSIEKSIPAWIFKI